MTPLFRRIVTEKRLLIWPLAMAIAANVIVYVVAVYPLTTSVADAEQRAAAATRAQKDAERDLRAARATASGKTRAEVELQKFYSDVLPPGFSAARRVTYLRVQQLARDANMTYHGLVATPERLREGDTLRRLQIGLTLDGSYEQVRRFIYAVETAPDFLVIDNVSLATVANASLLQVRVQLSTYFRATDDGA